MRTPVAMIIGSLLLFPMSAEAQNPVQTLSPNSAATVTNSYTQDLRDPSEFKGDALKDPAPGYNKTAPVTVGVGGLMGLGERETTGAARSFDTRNKAPQARPR
jgi:hypothetical protein